MIVFFVTERLAFGSKVRLYRHVAKLRELGITHVIDVRMYPSKKLRTFNTIHLNFKDNGRPRPMWFYARALRFYREALGQQNSKVYVMCRAGRRRSASLTYFLLRASGTSPSAAENTVLRARPCATIVNAYRESGENYLRRRESDCRVQTRNHGCMRLRIKVMNQEPHLARRIVITSKYFRQGMAYAGLRSETVAAANRIA